MGIDDLAVNTWALMILQLIHGLEVLVLVLKCYIHGINSVLSSILPLNRNLIFILKKKSFDYAVFSLSKISEFLLLLSLWKISESQLSLNLYRLYRSI